MDSFWFGEWLVGVVEIMIKHVVTESRIYKVRGKRAAQNAVKNGAIGFG